MNNPTTPEGKASWLNNPRAVLIVVVIVLIAIVARCTSEYGTGGDGEGVARVETSVCWSGSFGDRTVDGCGPQDVPLDSIGEVFVANAQKQSEGSESLTLVLLVDGREVDRATTSAAYGIAQVDSGPS
jgi:hypothetical protein